MPIEANDVAISSFVDLFMPYCDDKETILEIGEIASNPRRWLEAHDLFTKIRKKTLAAHAGKQAAAIIQYSFEESCAKTLYNLSGEPAPFDSNSSETVIPRAKALALQFGLEEADIENRLWA